MQSDHFMAERLEASLEAHVFLGDIPPKEINLHPYDYCSIKESLQCYQPWTS